MKHLMVAAVCVGVCLGAAEVALADLKEGTYAPDIEAKEWLNADAPVSLAELRGMVVVLYFWVSYHRGGEAFMPLINIVENHPMLGRRAGVFVLGVTEADRARTEEMIDEERVLFPIGVESKAAKDYDITSFPRVVVIDPTGKIVYSGWPGREEGGAFVQKLVDTVLDNPPSRTHPRERVEILKLLDQARQYVRVGNYRSAFLLARDALERACLGDELKTSCQELIDLLEALGRDRLAKAQELLDAKQYKEGVALLRDVARQFRALAVGNVAHKRLKSLEEKIPDAKRVLEALRRDAEARGLLAAARESLIERSVGEAYVTLEKIVKDYPEASVLGDAQTILRRMGQNEAVMAYVRDYKAEPDCLNWLAQARSFTRQGSFDKAREMLRRIIDKYPDTKWTDEAYRMLADLP